MKYYQHVLSSLNENGNIPSLNSLQSSFPSPEIYLNKYEYLYLIYNETYIDLKYKSYIILILLGIAYKIYY